MLEVGNGILRATWAKTRDGTVFIIADDVLQQTNKQVTACLRPGHLLYAFPCVTLVRETSPPRIDL